MKILAQPNRDLSRERKTPCYSIMLSLLALLTLLCSGAVLAVGLHKWVDADGNVHYSDKPPPGQQTETIEVDTGGVDADNVKRLDGYQDQVDDMFKKRDEAKADAAEKEREKAKMAAHCDKVRDQLARLQTSTRRQKVNEKGEREFIPETQRQEWINKAKGEIAKHCS